MKKLTPKFNEVTVKKGETFEIGGLMGGGFMGASWDIEVVSGKATKLRDTEQRMGTACVMGAVYSADEAGELEFVAKGWSHVKQAKMGGAVTFKVKVV